MINTLNFRNFIFIFLIALLIGVSVPLLTNESILLLGALIGVSLIISLVLFHFYITPRNLKELPYLIDDVSEDIKTKKYRSINFLYFLGTLTMAQLSIRAVGSLTISDIFYFTSIFLIFFTWIVNRKITYYVLNYWLGIGLFIFLIGATLSIFNSTLPIQSLSKVIRVVFIILIWFTASIWILKKEKMVYKAIVLWLVSVAINGLVAVLQLKWAIPLTTNHYGRMSSLTGHVSDLGGMSSVAWIPALIMATASKGKKTFFFYIILILVGLATILSGSVSGMLAIGVSTFIWLFLSKPKFKFLFILFLLSGVISIILSIQTANGYVTPMSRFESTTSTSANDPDGTMMSRLVTYQAAWEEIKQNPIVGVGYDDISNKTITGFPVHNFYLAAWYEGGIFAFIGMLIILCTILYFGIYSVRHAPSKVHYNLSLALFISFIAALVFGMTAPVLYQRYIWMPAALLLPLYKIALDHRNEQKNLKEY